MSSTSQKVFSRGSRDYTGRFQRLYQEVPESIWWLSKGLLEFHFAPHLGLRLEAGTKLNNFTSTTPRRYGLVWWEIMGKLLTFREACITNLTFCEAKKPSKSLLWLVGGWVEVPEIIPGNSRDYMVVYSDLVLR